MPNTISTLTLEIGTLLSGLEEIFSRSAAIKGYINFLGWELPSGVDDIGLAALEFAALLEKLEVVTQSSEAEWEDEIVMAPRIAALAVSTSDFVESIRELAESLPAKLSQHGDYVARTNIHKELPRRSFDLLIVGYVADRYPLLSSVLNLLNVVEFKHFDEDKPNFQLEHVRAIVHYDHIHALLSDPSSYMREAYGWGTAEFAVLDLLARIGEFFRALGASTRLQPMDPRAEQALTARAVPPDVDRAPQLNIYLYEQLGTFTAQTVGIAAFGVRPTSAGAFDGGIGFLPIVHGQAAGAIPLHTFSDTFLEFSAEADLLQRIALLLRPNQPLQLQRASSLADIAGGRVALGIRHGGADAAPKSLFTLPGGGQFSIRQFGFTGGFVKSTGSAAESFLELALLGGRFDFSMKQADSFLKDSVPQNELAAPFDLRVGWTSVQGIYFDGGSGLAVTLPVHASVGPFSLTLLTFVLNVDKNGFMLESSVNGNFKIGPLVISVERVGVNLAATFGSGNLGILGLSPDFKPPAGVGLAIDAGVVRGGGFLSFDTEKGEYAGALFLELEGGISLTALGLITTKLPGGQPGYSLIVVVTAEGFQPIPLGFGFMLTGIGGLLGVHRTINVEALQASVRTDSLSGVLAPKDVVANAAQFLSTLGRFFPTAREHYFFGPLAEITWGTPALITIKLAVVFEFGERTRLVVLGRILAILPRRDQDLVRLQMNVVGGIDFDRRQAFLDAALFDSRLVNRFLITGEMRLRMRWDDQPFFALAIGGVHPAFTPPPGLENMQRAAIVFADSENLKLRSESYLAITSNTVQFGARLDLFAKASKFSISGQAGYDVLIQFDPFHFIAAVYASLQLKAGSRSLFKVKFNGELSGPRPLRVRGKATFEILWWDYSVSFNTTLIGGSPPPPPPAIDVIPLLREALLQPASWSAALPERERLVALKEETTQQIRIHPLSVLTIKQNVLPLGVRVTKYGNAPIVGGAREFRVAQVQVGNSTVNTKEVRDHFAPGQFKDMSDDEKLSSPSFEMLEAGVSIGANEPQCGTAVTMTAAFEEIIIPEPTPPEETRPKYTMDAAVVSRVSNWRGGKRKASYRTEPIPLASRSKVYKVVAKTDLTKTGMTAEFSTRIEARDAFSKLSHSDKAKLQIVAQWQ